MSADDRATPTADLWSAIAWIVLGAAIVIGSWRMDRLEHLGATLYTAPGLVPGILGAGIALLGVILALRSRGGLAASPRKAARDAEAGGTGRVAVVLVLCLGYAVGLVGHIPFWLGTFLFVALFIGYFEYPMRRERGQPLRGVAMAIVYGAATSAIVSLVFEKVFLVRLP
jgi:Tripartite tricarboxylate transporter TctB family